MVFAFQNLNLFIPLKYIVRLVFHEKTHFQQPSLKLMIFVLNLYSGGPSVCTQGLALATQALYHLGHALALPLLKFCQEIMSSLIGLLRQQYK